MHLHHDAPAPCPELDGERQVRHRMTVTGAGRPIPATPPRPGGSSVRLSFRAITSGPVQGVAVLHAPALHPGRRLAAAGAAQISAPS